jgi:putative hemolysin
MATLIIQVLLICLLLLGAGFLSGSETALTTLSKDQLASLKEKYPHKLPAFTFWQEYANKVLAMLLIGNNFFHVGLGVVATSLAIHLSYEFGYSRNILLVAIPTFVTLLILVFGEIFPKIIARNNCMKFSVFSISILVFLVNAFDSFTRLFVWISDRIINLLGSKGLGYGVFLSSKELKSIFSSKECLSAGKDGSCVMEGLGLEMNVTTDTRQMLRNIIAFSETTTGEIMTPRTDMFAVDINEKPENIIKTIYTQGYSRVPVYSKNIDNIVGVIYAKDLLNSLRNNTLIFMQDLLRPAYFVPESAYVKELLKEFKSGQQRIAIVVDEYGGTAGVVTVEDALEEIIGEIYDEYDEKKETILQESENVWVVDVIENLEKVNERLGLNLPSEQYENLATFVLSLFGKLPKKGEIKIANNCKFEVLLSDKKRLYKIRVEKMHL